MPPNTVKVDRSTQWGNPFDFRKSEYCWTALAYGCRADPAGRREASIRAFREWITPRFGMRTLKYDYGTVAEAGDNSLPLGPRAVAGEAPRLADLRRELRGKNLACWCAPDAPCHADVLLELANAPDAADTPRGQRNPGMQDETILKEPDNAE